MRVTCICLACCRSCTLRDGSTMTPPTKMTSLNTRVSNSLGVEHSNRQYGGVMGSIPVGDFVETFFLVALARFYLIIYLSHSQRY